MADITFPTPRPGPTSPPAKVPVLAIEIDNLDWARALARFPTSRFIVTPNIDHLYTLRRHAGLRAAYRRADLVLCDSRILSLLSGFCCGTHLPQIAGSDYFPAVCHHYRNDASVRIFLLGGTTEVHAQRAAERLRSQRQARIVGHYSPPFGFEHDEAQVADIVARIAASGATAVAVGLGSPKQELFITRLLEMPTGASTFVGVGATIDFESGLLRRAPKLVTRAGVEWLYRFCQEPRRLFVRYFVHDPLVLFWLLRHRLRGQ